jgi:hypothetical protein
VIVDEFEPDLLLAALGKLQEIPPSRRKFAVLMGDGAVTSRFGRGLGPSVIGDVADRALNFCVTGTYGQILISRSILADVEDIDLPGDAAEFIFDDS